MICEISVEQKQNEKQNEKLSVRGCSGIGTKKIKKIKKS
jgi:hypothetical protein